MPAPEVGSLAAKTRTRGGVWIIRVYPHCREAIGFGKIGQFYLKPFPLMSNAAGYKCWICLLCGFVYDEALGWPDEVLRPGTRWDDVPANWVCPECNAKKSDFEMVTL